MYWLSKSFHRIDRFRKRLIIFLSVLGPGIIVMIADNDAGGISTYAVTGSKYGFSLLWMFVILLPMAYYVQEMTVRLGAVSKRGNAEAIFEGFGPFWGWFSLGDLIITNWLTLVTEYVGMIAAMSMFGIPPLLTFIAVTAILFTIVLTGQYWTFEKLTLFFCCFQSRLHPGSFLGHGHTHSPGLEPGIQGVLQSGNGRLQHGPHLYRSGQHRDHHRPMDDLLPAECGRRQGARHTRCQLRETGDICGIFSHLPRGRLHHHCSRCRLFLSQTSHHDPRRQADRRGDSASPSCWARASRP